MKCLKALPLLFVSLLAALPAHASMKGVAAGTQIGSPVANACGTGCTVLTLDDPFAVANNNPAYVFCSGTYYAGCMSVLLNEHVVASYHERPILVFVDGVFRVTYDLYFDADKFSHNCPAGVTCG